VSISNDEIIRRTLYCHGGARFSRRLASMPTFNPPLDVDLEYADEDGVITDRRVEITSSKRQFGLTYFRGYCHLRGDERTFRSDRIRSVTLQDGERMTGKQFACSEGRAASQLTSMSGNTNGSASDDVSSIWDLILGALGIFAIGRAIWTWTTEGWAVALGEFLAMILALALVAAVVQRRRRN